MYGFYYIRKWKIYYFIVTAQRAINKNLYTNMYYYNFKILVINSSKILLYSILRTLPLPKLLIQAYSYSYTFLLSYLTYTTNYYNVYCVIHPSFVFCLVANIRITTINVVSPVPLPILHHMLTISSPPTYLLL